MTLWAKGNREIDYTEFVAPLSARASPKAIGNTFLLAIAELRSGSNQIGQSPDPFTQRVKVHREESSLRKHQLFSRHLLPLFPRFSRISESENPSVTRLRDQSLDDKVQRDNTQLVSRRRVVLPGVNHLEDSRYADNLPHLLVTFAKLDLLEGHPLIASQ